MLLDTSSCDDDSLSGLLVVTLEQDVRVFSSQDSIALDADDATDASPVQSRPTITSLSNKRSLICSNSHINRLLKFSKGIGLLSNKILECHYMSASSLQKPSRFVIHFFSNNELV
ncbi:Uncharacterized protein Rs2_25870 [Raphanus sativus]|nr:Uncharacterized protein Rs2_25870 [Raphanus sativus]